MGIVFTNCPQCGGALKRAMTLIPDAVIVRCGHCRDLWIEGDTARYSIGDDPTAAVKLLRERVAALAEHSEEKRSMDAMHGSDDDPRWR